MGTVQLDDRFEGSTLDEAEWSPHHLPACSLVPRLTVRRVEVTT